MPKYFDLKRRFVERPQYDPDELLYSEISDSLLEWEKVLESRISVIVAPANFGKTTEMYERASALRTASHAAVFVALRKVADRSSFEKALDADSRRAFDAWKASPTVPLTLFVDSLDEASASGHDGIDYLLGEVAREVEWPNGLIRWVISTRPAVLSVSVLETITSLLVVPCVTTIKTEPRAHSAADLGASSTSASSGAVVEPEKMQVFSMVQLNSSQAKAYLAGKHSNLDAAPLLRLARERGLSGFTTSPGGLDVLSNMGLVGNPPESLTAVYSRVVEVVQELQRTDNRIDAAGGATPAALEEAARKLASASQVCQLPNIELADDPLAGTDGALSARKIAGGLLPDRVLNQLLNTQLFIDAGFNQVKLYPDEISPFLGAQRLATLVQSPESARKLVQHFTWKAPTGEQGAFRQFLPLMGWLGTLNPHCREEILEVEPQALAFFGDLRNPLMPASASKAALRESIRRLVEQGDRLGREMFSLSSEMFWQAGSKQLAPLLKELFVEYGTHHWARSALLDIAATSQLDGLRKLVLKDFGNSYQKLLKSSVDLRYILELGQPVDLAGLTTALMSDATVRESIVATLMTRLSWGLLGPTQVADLVHRQFCRGKGGYSISYAIDAGLIDDANDEQLYSFCRASVVRVARLRGRKFRPGRVRGHAEDRYIEIISGALQTLVLRPSLANHKRIALMIMLLERVMNDAHIGVSSRIELRKTLRENASVRFDFLTLSIRRARGDENMLWSAAYGYDSLCEFTAEEVSALNSPELTAVVQKHEETQSALRSKPQPVRRTRDDRLTISGPIKKELNADRDALRLGTATAGLAWVASWLLQTNPSSRYGDVNFEIFEREAGSSLAKAVLDGFSRVWRTQAPKYSESEPNSTYHITAAALQGLHIELGDGTDLPPLSHEEVQSALRYAAFEINGYPKWFWPLVERHQVIAGKELMRMVKHASAGLVSLEHAEQLLNSLDDAPQAIQNKLAPLAWTFLQSRPTLRHHVVEKLLAVATNVEGVVLKKEFEASAWSKIKSSFSGQLPSAEEAASSARSDRKLAIIWAASWLTGYPISFQKSMEQWSKKSPADFHTFIFAFAAHLGSERSAKLVRLAETSDQGVSALAALYEWTAGVVRFAEDPAHLDGEVYSYSDRPNAAQLLDDLIPAIASAKSQLAYEKIELLRLKATGPRAIYLRNVQFRIREEQSARPALPQLEYNDFERDFTAGVTDTTSFATTICNDLSSIKYDLEKGDYSLRRFFTDIVLQQGKTADEEEKESLALEADFQRLLASELYHRSKGRYSVTVEPHTAEAKRRDVLCSRGSMFASIELKMSKRWTLDKYIEALEKQLVGQYMRHRHATTGFLVIVLQEKGRYWFDGVGKKLYFNDLLTILSERALRLESEDRRRFIRVIGIDATKPENFRNATNTDKKASPGSKPRTPAKRRSSSRSPTGVTATAPGAPSSVKSKRGRGAAKLPGVGPMEEN